MKVGSLFAGIGGFDLAARWMGWSTAWFSEIEPYASKVLARHWPGVPNHGDITKINGREVEYVDVLCGGFPCQDISVAQTRPDVAGIDGARSGLWFEFARLIEESQPGWVVAENSPVLRSRGLDRVLGSLVALGYDAEWHCIPAAYVGAPHRRDRIWIIAHAGSKRLPGPVEDSRLFEPETQTLALDGNNSARRWLDMERDRGRLRTGDGDALAVHRKRIHALGNAIVPQVALLLFKAIQKREEALRGLSHL